MRYSPILKLMLLPILNVLGPILIGFSLSMLFPLALSLWKQDGAHRGFELSFCITFLVGFILWAATRRYKRELIPRDGFLLVTMAWVSLALFASIPLYVEIPHIPYTHALFEATSGITTTCATILNNLDKLPVSINFWRCFLSWLGGIGILVMAVAVLPLLGVGGAQIFRAETSGPIKEGKLTPRIADTAKAFYVIYLALSAACAVCFHFGGMDWDDAVMHMFTTVSLGGFSSHDASFAYWPGRTINCIAVIFCLFSGINFTMHFIAWRKLSLSPYLRDVETRAWFLTAFLITLIVMTLLLSRGIYSSVTDAFYYALTNTIYVISTSGFANTNYGDWPLAAQIILLFGSCFATCAGSTGGGIKMIRFIALVKQGNMEFKRILHPKMVRPLMIGDRLIDSKVVFSVLAFLMIYIVAALISTLFFILTGLDGLTAFSTALACLNNLGPALGQLGPAYTFSSLDASQILFCSGLMVLGRLELLTVLVLFTRTFWKF
jgi:trk system potassium uptake protein TrkH